MGAQATPLTQPHPHEPSCSTGVGVGVGGFRPNQENDLKSTGHRGWSPCVTVLETNKVPSDIFRSEVGVDGVPGVGSALLAEHDKQLSLF